MAKEKEDLVYRGKGHCPMRFTKGAIANRIKRNNRRRNRGKGSKHV
jgi:hypothetical protein